MQGIYEGLFQGTTEKQYGGEISLQRKKLKCNVVAKEESELPQLSEGWGRQKVGGAGVLYTPHPSNIHQLLDENCSLGERCNPGKGLHRPWVEGKSQKDSALNHQQLTLSEGRKTSTLIPKQEFIHT